MLKRSTKDLHKRLVSRIDGRLVAGDLVSSEWDGESNLPCPFHDDSTPSFSIGEGGKTYCFGCDYKSSSVVGLTQDLEDLKYRDAVLRLWDAYVERLVPEDEVDKAHTALMRNPLVLQRLRDRRGISKKTARRLKLGWRGDRLWIPVYNAEGLCVDVRRYDLLGRRKKGGPKIASYKKGFGSARLWPAEMLTMPGRLLLCEGEMDASLAIDRGVNAVTITGGASTIPQKAIDSLKSRSVVVIPDNDKAGRKGATKRFRLLARSGVKARMARLPVSEGEDFSDWVLSHDGDPNKVPLVSKSKEPDLEDNGASASDSDLDLPLSDSETLMIERADAVMRLMESSGSFFKEESGALYYAPRGGHSIPLHGRELQAYMSRLSPAINQATSFGRFTLNHVVNRASFSASLVSLGAWSMFRDMTVYLYAGQDHIIKCDSSGSEVQDNAVGPNKILLESPTKSAAVLHKPKVRTDKGVSLLWRLLARNIPCSDSDRYLIICWLMGVLFRDYIRAKPLMRFVARSASGKSTATKLMSHLIYGEELMSHSASTIAASYGMARTHPILLLDNIETRNMSPQFEDFLLTVSTGGSKAKRATATDTGIVVEKSNCLVASNGIEPLSRSELINRTIEVELDIQEHGREGFHEFQTVRDIQESRDTILNSLLKLAKDSVFPRLETGEVSRIARALPRHSMDRFNDYIGLMAIFLDAIWPYRPSDKWRDTHELMDVWLESQSASAKERQESTSELVYFLTTFAERRDRLMDAGIKVKSLNGSTTFRATARELLTDFRLLAKHLGVRCPWVNERQLGSRIVDAEQNLVEAGWSIRRTKSAGRNFIRFEKHDGPKKRRSKG